MAVVTITSITASAPVDATVQKLSQALKASNVPARFVVGTKVQDSSIIQVTSEWTETQSASDLEASTAFTSFTDTIQSFSNSSTSPATILATLDYSPFSNGVAPIIEYVKTDFSTSLATPAYQTQIETDFAKFEQLYRKRGDPKSVGELGLVTGWSQEYDSLKEDGSRESVRSFVVARSWKSMGDFETAVQTEIFKEAVPILMGWGAPFQLVSIAYR
jgi:hypothetical protein